MKAPIVCLLSDFGLSDHYVAVMKGEILKACPRAVLVDITHAVSPQSVNQGGFVLAQTVLSYPKETIFLAVVDPGVGSQRRALACTMAGYAFVLPDNGLISMTASKLGAPISAVELATPESASFTFHGRDVFAPAAGRLAAGARLEELGEPVHDLLLNSRVKPSLSAEGIEVARLYTDVFGNVCFDCRSEDCPDFFHHEQLCLFCGRPVRFARTFADVAEGEPLLLWNSSGYLELAVRNGRADLWWEPKDSAEIQQSSS